jgi:hypothetical protein
MLVIGALLLFFLLGRLAPTPAYPLMLIVALAGYVFFFLSLTAFLRNTKGLPVFIFLTSCLIFAVWLSSLCWAFMLKPIFFESIVAASSKLWLTDTLYHVSMTQMIKTYHVPSTGIDGIPYMKYHFGSHWLFAMLSKLLKLSVADFYNLAYPVIFPPLLFQTFFYFILEVRAYLFKETKAHTPHLLFWFMLLGIFIGFTKSLIAGNGLKAFHGSDVGILFFSESYLLSIFCMFACFALMLYFWRNQSLYDRKDRLLFYLLLLPVLLSVTGFMKVSTMYVMAGMLGYFFLRLKLYGKAVFVASIILLLICFVLTYYWVVDFSYSEGGFDWFYFFRVEQVPLLKFFSYLYLWSYLFIAIFFVAGRLYSLEAIKRSFLTRQTLAVECILVTLLLGLLPVSVLVLFVANALYFIELNVFIAGALFLAYLPLFESLLVSLRERISRPLYFILSGVAILWSVVIWQYNARGYMNVMIGANFIDRTTLVKDTTSEDEIRIGVMRAMARLDISDMQRILKPYGQPLQAALDSNKVYRVLKALRKLDGLPLAEKRKSLIYVDLSAVDTSWQVKCHNLPFIVPALSGIAALNGGLSSDCSWNGGYGFDSYSRKEVVERNKTYSLQQLCAQAKAKGFEYIYTYEPKTNQFVRKDCQP